MVTFQLTDYQIEAKKNSLKGTITCGSRVGYNTGAKEFSLEETLTILDETNKQVTTQGLRALPCIVTEGTLVGRSESGNYHERVYILNFSQSPRTEPIADSKFHESLLAYAQGMGKTMGQERVYIDFNGQTEVLVKR